MDTNHVDLGNEDKYIEKKEIGLGQKDMGLKAATHWPNHWPSDEFRNKSVPCVQLCWKLLEPRGQCLV